MQSKHEFLPAISPVATKFSLGTFTATPHMYHLINRALETGRLSYGPLSKQFETRFANLHDRNYGVLSNSGTSSLQVALQAMKELYGWADGDEVIVPALTFVATVNVVYHCKLTPVLVDVHPDFYDMEPHLLEAAITDKTRCIIPVHAFGLPCDREEIMSHAEHFKLKVIEDSCESMFVYGQGRAVGAWGEIGCFSTYIAHIITGGVGGIAITDDYQLARSMRSLVNHGIDLSEMPTGTAYDPTFLGRNFSFRSIGHSFRVTELEAAVLIPQLDSAVDNITQRQLNATRISAILSPYAEHLQLPTVRPRCESANMVYPIVRRDGSKHRIMDYLRQHGVECRDMLPLTNQPCYDFIEAYYPVSANINHRGFYIGCHQNLTNENFSHLAQVFADFFKEG